MYLVVSVATSRVLTASAGPIPPEDWGEPTVTIERADVVIPKEQSAWDVLRAEAAAFGEVINLDDIIVDKAGKVVAVSRNRPLPEPSPLEAKVAELEQKLAELQPRVEAVEAELAAKSG
jgi:hypothetical protein